jgi:hypothetical protein
MVDDPPRTKDSRVFSDQEVGVIVHRAAELQEKSAARSLGSLPAIGREQLERIAREVGVEPEFVERALAERPAGGRLLRVEERVVMGALDPRDFDLVLAEVQPRPSGRNRATQIGQTLQARLWTGAGLAKLEVTSRDERTHVRLKVFPVFEILGALYPPFLASLLGGGALVAGGHLAGAGVLAAGAFTAGLLGLRAWLGASHRRVMQMADRVEGVVTRQLAGQGRPPG